MTNKYTFVTLTAMPTLKKRINLSVANNLYSILETLAKRDSVTTTTKALELLRRAVETEEDSLLNKIAEERDTKNARFISHNNAWK